MPDSAQIPYLLRLIDDESEGVRNAVARALAAFGPSLEEELVRLPEPPSDQQMQMIRDLLEGHSHSVASPAEDATLFAPGQLVHHIRYDYRGVVVSVDATCRADDDWYLANRTQPDRDQPWYHILVHDSQQVTYAAQTSLEADPSSAEIDHPLVPHLFSDFVDGRYVRNNTAWPES